MFCIHCGAHGAVNFCAVCGLSQTLPVAPSGLSGTVKQAPAVIGMVESSPTIWGNPKREPISVTDAVFTPTLVPHDDDSDEHAEWTQELNYQAVLSATDARKRIAAAGWGVTPGLTADDLLAIFDAVSPIGVSLQKLNGALLPIYDKIGIKTLRWARGSFIAPPGRVLLALMCVLAKNSLEVAEVHQEVQQCGLTVKIPSSLYTNQGQLLVLLRHESTMVQMEIRTRILGQYFDWGKSKRLIDHLFSGIQADLTQQLGVAPQSRRVA